MGDQLDPETLSRLIGLIYDSAVDAARWEVALKAVCAALNFEQSGLMLTTIALPNPVLDIVVGAEERWRKRIADYWEYLPIEWGAAFVRHPLNEPAVLTWSEGWAERERTPYYYEWLRPQGLIDVLVGYVVRKPYMLATVGFCRGEAAGPITGREVDAFRLLLPHFQRAVAIGTLLDHQRNVADDFRATLRGVATAVVLVDAELRVVHANEAAEALLATGDPLRVRDGVLTARSRPVAESMLSTVRQGDAAEAQIGRRGFGIPAARVDGSPAIIHVLPLRQGKRRNLAPRATAAIFVASGAAPSVDDALAALFDLTQSEARVFALIAAGKSPAEAAASLGVAMSTVRTHLLHIFAKTGTGRQAELTQLAGSLALPL